MFHKKDDKASHGTRVTIYIIIFIARRELIVHKHSANGVMKANSVRCSSGKGGRKMKSITFSISFWHRIANVSQRIRKTRHTAKSIHTSIARSNFVSEAVRRQYFAYNFHNSAILFNWLCEWGIEIDLAMPVVALVQAE